MRALHWLVALAVFLAAHSALAADVAALPIGKGAYQFATEAEPLEVHYFKPAGLTAESPVWFVMHGVNRNADEYRDNWIELGTTHRALIVTPRFSKEAFPNYQTGELRDASGALRPPEKTAFRLLERVFSDVVEREGLTSTRYCLFGHSAGGQFVHRMVLFEPEHRIAIAVAANAGWYTVPVQSAAFPYGMGGTGSTDESLARAFATPLCVLLGEADTDPMHPQLNRSARANEQGPHRLARGRYFFDAARREAERLEIPFRWTLETVPGVAHSNGRMAPVAARLMADALRSGPPQADAPQPAAPEADGRRDSSD